MAEFDEQNYEQEEDDFFSIFGEEEEEEVESAEGEQSTIEPEQQSQPDGSQEFLKLAQQVKNDNILTAYSQLRAEGFSDKDAIKYMYDYMKEKGVYQEEAPQEPTFETKMANEVASLRKELEDYKRKEAVREVSSRNAGKAFSVLNKYGIEATDDNASKYNKTLLEMYPQWDGTRELTESQVKNIVQLAFARDMAAKRRANKDASRQEGAPRVLQGLSTGGMTLREVKGNLRKNVVAEQKVTTNEDRIKNILATLG